ncbi:MAG TPA: MBL fold metallo-hydrolase [Anaerolineae bacterium]|nr:MBL fold metallo-hydrolase [Anaerolineae bacterium]
MRITLMGHMTVRIELDGMVLLTDPWFGPHRWLEERLAPRTVPLAAVPDELVPLDAMLVSHNHVDHLDGAALDLARPQGCMAIEPAVQRWAAGLEAEGPGSRCSVPARPGM